MRLVYPIDLIREACLRQSLNAIADASLETSACILDAASPCARTMVCQIYRPGPKGK